jgi:hypothetical protein
MCKFYWELLEIVLYIFKDSNERIGIGIGIIIIIGIVLQVKKSKNQLYQCHVMTINFGSSSRFKIMKNTFKISCHNIMAGFWIYGRLIQHLFGCSIISKILRACTDVFIL